MMKTDLERAIAVIADLCGAGRPAVKESAEELAEWAEEFTDRYFSRAKCPCKPAKCIYPECTCSLPSQDHPYSP
jgi:hypothetical protein